MTNSELAEILSLPVSTIADLRKREGWPHVRLGKAVRFTPEQVAEIVASHTVTDAPAKEEPTVLGGLTRRSASHASRRR